MTGNQPKNAEEDPVENILRIIAAILVTVLLAILITGAIGGKLKGGAQLDAERAATKQTLITECGNKGMYPVLDEKLNAVYCSAVPVYTR